MERDYIYNQLQTAWAIVTTFREQIARRKTQIEMDRQEIWLQMQAIHALTARLRDKELQWANLGKVEAPNE